MVSGDFLEGTTLIILTTAALENTYIIMKDFMRCMLALYKSNHHKKHEYEYKIVSTVLA